MILVHKPSENVYGADTCQFIPSSFGRNLVSMNKTGPDYVIITCDSNLPIFRTYLHDVILISIRTVVRLLRLTKT